MAPVELQEIIKKLQELLDKGFISPNISSRQTPILWYLMDNTAHFINNK